MARWTNYGGDYQETEDHYGAGFSHAHNGNGRDDHRGRHGEHTCFFRLFQEPHLLSNTVQQHLDAEDDERE